MKNNPLTYDEVNPNPNDPYSPMYTVVGPDSVLSIASGVDFVFRGRNVNLTQALAITYFRQLSRLREFSGRNDHELLAVIDNHLSSGEDMFFNRLRVFLDLYYQSLVTPETSHYFMRVLNGLMTARACHSTLIKNLYFRKFDQVFVDFTYRDLNLCKVSREETLDPNTPAIYKPIPNTAHFLNIVKTSLLFGPESKELVGDNYLGYIHRNCAITVNMQEYDYHPLRTSSGSSGNW